jgi:hypothetical protein
MQARGLSYTCTDMMGSALFYCFCVARISRYRNFGAPANPAQCRQHTGTLTTVLRTGVSSGTLAMWGMRSRLASLADAV